MSAKNFFVPQLTFSNHIIHQNIEDISNDEAALFPSGANSVNWLLGHIIYGRNLVIRLLNGGAVWDEAQMKCYARGIKAADFVSDFLPFDKLKALNDEAFRRISSLIELADIAEVENDLAGLSLHEIYHVGQIGYCRRLLGKEGKIK